MTLEKLGWNTFFADAFTPFAEAGFVPGRVVFEDNLGYRVQTADGEVPAKITGKLRYEAQDREQLPAVGDWVALKTSSKASNAMVHAVLPRRSRFARKVAGARTEQQIVGANIDTVLIVTSLNSDFSVRRVERYLLLARESGADPVVVLSKADLCDDVESAIESVREAAGEVAVYAVSARTGQGIENVRSYLRIGETVALLGSSGVGKSTLINHLLGYERQQIKEIRESDGRGQHATRHRELILLPDGGLVLDTPGMRELQLWGGTEGLQQTFVDVEAISLGCRFSDCTHEREPGCAVREALESGALESGRLESYFKLQREIRSFEVRHNDLASRLNRQKWKKLTKQAKERARTKRGGDGS
jgi:ribosome biogenesis GTPase